MKNLPKPLVVGVSFAGLTLLFLMGMVVASLKGHEIPNNSRFPVVAILALTVGMAAGFIGGSATIRGHLSLIGLKPASKFTTFSATGGIGALVLVMTLGYAFYVKPGAEPAVPELTNNDRVWDYKERIMKLRGSAEASLHGNLSALEHVLAEAPKLGTQLQSFTDGLSPIFEIIRDEYSAFAFFMAADAFHRDGKRETACHYIDTGITVARKALGKIESARSGNDADLRAEIVNRHIYERTTMIFIFLKSLDAVIRKTTKPEEVVEMFRSLETNNPQVLKLLEINPATTPYLSDILRSSGYFK